MVLTLPGEAYEAIVRHARWCEPEEACGLLAGPRPDEVAMVYPLDNVERSPVRFTIDPVGHFRALRHAERNGWDLIGAFHSHPSSEAYPSATDVRLAYEAEWAHVVVSLEGDEPVVRAFRIVDTAVTELRVRRPVRPAP